VPRRKPEPVADGGDRENAVLVGRLLGDRRRGRGLTLEEVGLALRVAPRHVQAVEEGRIADLPPQPYPRGLVSAYARLVGFDPEEILRVCGAALAVGGRERRTRIFRYPAEKRFNWREWTVPFALTAAVVTLVIARAALAPKPIPIEAPAAAPPVAARPVQQAAALADAPAPSAPAAAAPVAAPGVRVGLRCEGTTWAEAAADGGEVRRYELGPGQNLEIIARERLALSLGDAGVIRLKVNERELGFIGYKGETKLGLSFEAPKAPRAAPPPAAAGD
jgi:hypothetical protein